MPEQTNTAISTSDTIKPLDELIAEARAALTTRHETAKKQHLTQSRANADAAWQESEHQRKLSWCRNWWSENFYPLSDPYEDFHDEDYVRVYLPYEGRAEALCRVGLIGEGLRVWLFRRGRKATVVEVQEFLSPWMPTKGEITISEDRRRSEDWILVHAEGISPELRDLLRSAGGIEVNRGVVRCSDPRMDKKHPEHW
jgi:hypothetical protein